MTNKLSLKERLRERLATLRDSQRGPFLEDRITVDLVPLTDVLWLAHENLDRLERIEAALAPFAEALGEDTDDDFGDEMPAIVKIGQRTTLYSLTLGDLRTARTALEEEGQ